VWFTRVLTLTRVIHVLTHSRDSRTNTLRGRNREGALFLLALFAGRGSRVVAAESGAVSWQCVSELACGDAGWPQS
jgi:hypothetical protein